MNEYTSKKEREHIEAQFDAFMNHSIRNCAHNVTRMVSADEKKRRCISLDTLDEDCIPLISNTPSLPHLSRRHP